MVCVRGGSGRIGICRSGRQLIDLCNDSLAGFNVHRVGFGAMQLPGRAFSARPGSRPALLCCAGPSTPASTTSTPRILRPTWPTSSSARRCTVPDSLALVSKVGGKRDYKGAWLPDAEPHRLRAGIEDNLRSLGSTSWRR